MAFVCKSEKPAFIPSHEENPGPGYYPLPNSSKMGHGYAPFLSTAPKLAKPKKNGVKPPPGPGAYNLPSSFQATDKTSKVSYSTLNRHQQPLVEYVNQTTIFKSKVKRFESLERESVPGPGAYEHQEQYKRRNSLSLAVAHSNVIVDRIIEQNKKGVASIPSHMNRYGYSEDDKHNLIANKNPLFELQKYVGPGYYQAPEHFGANKSKGIAWDRSNGKRFDDGEMKKATRTSVGPGTYELEIKAAPAYQNKPTASFASKIARDSLVEKKSSPKKRSISVPPRRGQSLINEVASNDQSLMFVDQFREEMDDLIALQEIADIAPGPGHYYNDRINSSLRTSYKPPRLQFFGSSTERFPLKEPIIPTAGPGEYHERNKSEPSNKSKKRAPFSTATKRFDKEVPEMMTPGPGAYDAKQMILDRIKDRERLGYIGSFGMTDKRFKDATMPNNTQPRPESSLYHAKTEATPVDEKIDISTNQKPNQSFQSKVPRESVYVKKDKIPPPGTYDLGYYDLSKKIVKDTNNETRPPFNVASSRFKKQKIEERPINEEEESARSRGYPPERKSRMNAVFVSQTKKNFEAMPTNNNVPGPGQYTKSVAGGWVKKTYNINFMQD